MTNALTVRYVECTDCDGKGFGFTPEYWICPHCCGWGIVRDTYKAACELAENANVAPEFTESEAPQ